MQRSYLGRGWAWYGPPDCIVIGSFIRPAGIVEMVNLRYIQTWPDDITEDGHPVKLRHGYSTGNLVSYEKREGGKKRVRFDTMN